MLKRSVPWSYGLQKVLSITSIAAMLFIMLPISFIGCHSVRKKGPEQLKSHYLDSLENLFSQVPNWLQTVYEEKSGGFYHNALMASDTNYAPDIQSTNFALNILITGNIVPADSHSKTFKQKVTAFVENRYDDSLQLYIDPKYEKELLQSERNLARAQNMAFGIYSKLGAPKPRKEASNSLGVPSYLSSLQSFEDWFHAQNWERVWTAFDKIVSNVSFLNRIPQQRADSIVHFVEEYAQNHQDMDGLWGGGQAMEIRISGAAKYGTFCRNLQIPVPKADKMYTTIMTWFEENKKLDFSKYSSCPICVPRNALKALFYIKPYLSFKIPEKDKVLLVQKTFEMLKYYSGTDGGFMKNPKETKIAPLDLNLGAYDRSASDINATHLAVTARASLYSLLDEEVPKIKYDESGIYKEIDTYIK